MILLTRLSGSAFALNPDLIERIDSTPDTVVTLVDGPKYVVAEPMVDVIAIIREYRASVLVCAAEFGVERGLVDSAATVQRQRAFLSPAVESALGRPAGQAARSALEELLATPEPPTATPPPPGGRPLTVVPLREVD